jgi:hypothetical protein
MLLFAPPPFSTVENHTATTLDALCTDIPHPWGATGVDGIIDPIHNNQAAETLSSAHLAQLLNYLSSIPSTNHNENSTTLLDQIFTCPLFSSASTTTFTNTNNIDNNNNSHSTTVVKGPLSLQDLCSVNSSSNGSVLSSANNMNSNYLEVMAVPHAVVGYNSGNTGSTGGAALQSGAAGSSSTSNSNASNVTNSSGVEGDWLMSVPIPAAVSVWEKAKLESYSPKKNLIYYVLAPLPSTAAGPNNSTTSLMTHQVYSQLHNFFKDLTTVYEVCCNQDNDSEHGVRMITYKKFYFVFLPDL